MSKPNIESEVQKIDGLFKLYNMRKIFSAYRFHLLYDRLAG